MRDPCLLPVVVLLSGLRIMPLYPASLCLLVPQATMEEMANELEQRAEAIRNCGTEILRVRKQKEDVDRALKEANSKCVG